MSYFPLNYSQLNAIEGSYTPSTVKIKGTASFSFWERSLFQRACSTLKFELPEEWKGEVRDFFYYCLFRCGYVGVFDTVEYGLTFQPGTLNGFDWYYQPTNFLVSNPKASLDLQIGEDCEIIKLTPDYMGIWDIISYYAEKLAIASASIDMNLINSKFSWVLGARNKQAAQALKKIVDLVNQGNPAVVFDTSLLLPDDETDKEPPWQFLDIASVKDNYMVSTMLQDLQTLLNNFDSEVGIPTIPYAKKERMVTDEAESRKVDATSRSKVWVDTLRSSLEKVNAHYGTNIAVKALFEEEEEETDGENNNARPDGMEE